MPLEVFSGLAHARTLGWPKRHWAGVYLGFNVVRSFILGNRTAKIMPRRRLWFWTQNDRIRCFPIIQTDFGGLFLIGLDLQAAARARVPAGGRWRWRRGGRHRRRLCSSGGASFGCPKSVGYAPTLLYTTLCTPFSPSAAYSSSPLSSRLRFGLLSVDPVFDLLSFSA